LSELRHEDGERVKKCAVFQQMDLQSDLLQFSESLGSPIFSVPTFHPLSYYNPSALSLLATLIAVFIFIKRNLYIYILTCALHFVYLTFLTLENIHSLGKRFIASHKLSIKISFNFKLQQIR
jgi:hypothetical protein